MAAAGGREGTDLSDRLLGEPWRFDFFQAVRLLERLQYESAGGDPRAARQPVGHDTAPGREVVRFRALTSLSFPAAPIAQVRRPPSANGAPGADAPPLEMVVSFLGLTGPSGVLPLHYTALLLRRLRDKDTSLRDLLDVFHHRLVSLFYRAWEKYRLPFAYERSRLTPTVPGPDPVTQGLYSLVGLGTDGLRGRQEFPDEALLFYGGHFAHYPRSAAALELLLGDYFGLPVRVLQFEGQWLSLEVGDQARLPAPGRPSGQNNRLGHDLVIGERIWDVQGRFRLRLGPLTYAQFRRFFPGEGDRLRPFCQLARSYVGLEFAFDLQLVLRPDEVPGLRLGGDGDDRPCLGWNTWVSSGPFTREVDDVVFSGE
jgi:type VI secretion system protein ImpH